MTDALSPGSRAWLYVTEPNPPPSVESNPSTANHILLTAAAVYRTEH